MFKCERCGSSTEEAFRLHDYCALCSKQLCNDCMEEGCCGHLPALSGMEVDSVVEEHYEDYVAR
jgi:hypothetical protein